MKLFIAIGKNLKLLFRNKESAYTIVFGPLLIILLVSFAFLGSSDDYKVRVATFAPANTQFSVRTIGLLNQKGYLVSVYPDQEHCVESVKEGSAHVCIVFSDKEPGNQTVPITFYVDASRFNIIYQIADDVSSVINVQADAIRQQLASDAVQRMQTAQLLVERDLNATSAVSDHFDLARANITLARESLSQLSNTTPNISLAGVRAHQLGLAMDARAIGNITSDAIGSAETAIRSLQSRCDNCSTDYLNEISDDLTSLEDARTQALTISQDKVDQQLADSDLILGQALDELDRLQETYANESVARDTLRASVEGAAEHAAPDSLALHQVVTSMRYTDSLLKGDTTNASVVGSPVTTSVVSVTVANDQLSFTYPYLLVLVIMFMGMLLSSILIVTDKTSRARFRNFTTPTPDGYHIFVAFLTAFFLLILEVFAILLLSSFFVTQPLLLNPASTLGLVCVAIVLFTFLGMVIGYLSRTQEAAMIASISVGSVLLFVSNLIIPIEGMAQFVQAISGFNPYLVLSELLKKSMLYGVTLDQVSQELLLLLAFAAVLFIITILIQRRARRKYFRQDDDGILAPRTPAPLALSDRQVRSEAELLDALDHMTRAEFESVVTADDNVISRWVGKELRDRRLARQLRTTSKERMILRIDRFLEKHGKHLKR